MHQTGNTVNVIAEEHRIGNLDKRDIDAKQAYLKDDPYRDDPVRHPAMITNSLKPWCGECPGSMLAVIIYNWLPTYLSMYIHYVRQVAVLKPSCG